jgi:hypothetical protein
MATGTLALILLLATTPGVGDTFPMKERSLRIPIKVDPARRSQIKELRLFSSSDQGKTWQQVAVAHPDDSGFPFNAPTDGEYWFSVVVIDMQGRSDPENIYQVPPSQKIVVDSLKPVVRLVSTDRLGEEAAVAWEIQEEHPDFASMKLEYRPADAPPNVWYPAAITPALAGQTRFRLTSPAPVAVRIQLQDQAGNVGSASGDIAAASNMQMAANPAAAPPVAPPSAPPAPVVPPAGSPTAAVAAVGGSPWEQNRPSQSVPLVNEPRYSPEYNTYPPAVAPSNYQTAGSAVADPNVRQVLATSETAAPLPTPALTQAVSRLAHGLTAPLFITNNKQVTLDYDVKPGPSGVGKVDLWITKDDGRTWEWYAENRELKPPMTVELPGEGVYGFSLVVQNRAGVGKKPPASGDAPEMRVELDTTPPSAQLFAPQPDPRQRDAVVLSWSATDRNLPANPITLQWAEQRDGPWNNIKTGLPNNGSYSWKLPETLPPQVFLQLTAVDSAGNPGVAVTAQTVVLDLKEPEGHLLGIRNAVRRP